MFPIVPPLVTALVIAAMFVLVMFAVRVVRPPLWKKGWLRWSIILVFATLAAGVALWVQGRHSHDWAHVTQGCAIAYFGVISLAPACVLSPVSALAMRSKGVSRRGLLRAGFSALPFAASATSTSGFISARLRPRMPVVSMAFDGLHPDLEGFRILHLSDVHLGACISLEDLDTALKIACETTKPDLVVLTGDLADDIAQVPAALDLLARAPSRYGAFSALGNHEYLHDIKNVRPLFEKSKVPLLVSSGRTLNVGRARLYVGGADDPFFVEGDVEGMLRPSIAKTASLAPKNADFRMLLCHRPEGHAPAAANGFDLTLAGHTHGGQLGFLGRSVFEWLAPKTSWWGRYEKKRPDGRVSRLYTTSGFGHWFPFRLGCPTELPVIVLTRSMTTESRTRGTRLTDA